MSVLALRIEQDFSGLRRIVTGRLKQRINVGETNFAVSMVLVWLPCKPVAERLSVSNAQGWGKSQQMQVELSAPQAKWRLGADQWPKKTNCINVTVQAAARRRQPTFWVNL